jgi:hypothetical protein
VGADIVLPERAFFESLPAFDGFGGGFVARVRSQFVLDSPAADAGAVGLEVEAAQQFTGAGAVGGGRFGGEQLGEQAGHFGRPVGVMIATGKSRRPSLTLATGTGLKVLAVELVEAGQSQAQLVGGRFGIELAVAMSG